MARSFACGCPYILCGMTFDIIINALLDGQTIGSLDEIVPRICLFKTGSNCSGTTTSNTSSQALNYNWSTSNSAIVSISGSSTNSTVGGFGAGVGTATMTGRVSATYFQPAQTCNFSGGGNNSVQKPGFLAVVSSGTAFACNGAGCEAQIQYKVLDVNNAPIRIAGMTVKETTSVSSSCGPGDWVNASTWTTDANGVLQGLDKIHICGTGNCNITITQTFTVNGSPVLIMSSDGVTTGTKNVINITLSNGQSSCPNIVITP
jgi:hypothetical protein